MNRFCPIVSLSSLLMVLLLIFSTTANAAVTVTPASSGTCLNLSPGAYLAIGDIVIQENNNGDFSSAANRTLILSAPANFQFQAGIGTVSFQAGRNISSASIAVVAGTITVTYTVSGTNRIDRMTISGILARATSAPASGNILRTGGTATISGDATGGGTADIDVDGSISISNGTLSLKYETGAATLDVLGSYSQSGGTFNMHSRNATTANSNNMNVYGNFLMSNGTFRFDNFAIVDGAGNSITVLTYKETDKKPLNGINYYRLMQTDYDGKFTYSEIRTVIFGTKGSIAIFPNPAPENHQIQVSIPVEGEYN